MNQQELPGSNKSATQAMDAYQQKKYIKAADLFGKASEEFLQDNDHLKAAEMRNNQSVALLQAGKAKESLKAARGTELVFAEANDMKRQAMALANIAAALNELNQKTEAIELYEESSRIFKEIGETDLRAEVGRSLSVLKVKKGKFTDAVMDMQDGLMDVEKPTLKQRILKKFLFMRLWK